MYTFNPSPSGLPNGDEALLEQHARMMGDYGRRMADRLRRLDERVRHDPRFAPAAAATPTGSDRRQHPAFLFDEAANNANFDRLFDSGFSHPLIFPPPPPTRPVYVDDEARRRAERRVWEAQRAAEESRKEAERAYEAARRKAMEAERRAIQSAWETYEARWAALQDVAADDPWAFDTVPWPQYPPPTTPQDLRLHSMSRFLLAECHSTGVSVKDRIRSALLRWHPDKFMGKHMQKVKESDREMVREGVNAVCRLLHTLQENLVRSPGRDC